jgi:hypothetical protein
VRIPVDTSKLIIIAGGPAKPVTDREGKPRTDRDGQVLYSVDLSVLCAGERPDTWSVRLTAEPRGLDVGMPVKVTGLSAGAYDISDDKGNRNVGVSFRADSIEPANGAKPSGGS